MSTSRRSSKSTKSTATTRSSRPPVWRATSLVSGNAPAAPLIVSKNSSAPEVSIVTAEPETISGLGSTSAASQLAPSISRRSKLVSSSSTSGRLRVDRKNSTRTRLQGVFPNTDLGEGGSHTRIDSYAPCHNYRNFSRTFMRFQPVSRMPSGSSVDVAGIAFPSYVHVTCSSFKNDALSSYFRTSSPALLESTNSTSTSAYPDSSELSSSSSPSSGSRLDSPSRCKGKEKAVDASPVASTSTSEQETPRPAAQSLAVAATDGAMHDDASSSSTLTQADASGTIRGSSFPVAAEAQTPKMDHSLHTKDPSNTVRGSEAPKHSWFNPFAPYPSRPSKAITQSPPSTSPSTSPTSPSPLRKRTSSSYVESIDDEVPAPIRTPAFSDDEDGHKTQQTTSHLSSTLAPTGNDSTKNETSVNATTQTLEPRKRLDSLNSLNPSTSRFSISIPLLGRPKMRLEDAVKREKGVEDGGGSLSKDSETNFGTRALASSSHASN
ncbi:hypothetical protein F5878DRAFT_241927 [Lentinula raphanica]|uniref:Uncharacterized protein n=1 Tax=Lentinula raphanica TaxID=153919 RepID=A0AA38P6B5_9AGAR|nr:hypothetical protein F5878DRAFT_241927 [Lentinula raphanica]